jgi:hypothetical protein
MIIKTEEIECPLQHVEAKTEEVKKIEIQYLNLKEKMKITLYTLAKIFTCTGFKKIGSNFIVLD